MSDPCKIRLCLGAENFGTLIPESESNQILDCYYEAGGRDIDTANNYADRHGLGTSMSEKTIGRWMASRRPVELNIATKAGMDRSRPSGVNLSRDHLLKELGKSLENLKLNSVQIFWLHRDDPRMPVGEILGALTDTIRFGMAARIGCCNWKAGRIDEFQTLARGSGTEGYDSLQLIWSLAKRNGNVEPDGLLEMDAEHWDLHAREGLRIYPFFTMACGFLSGKYGRDLRLPDTPRAAFVSENYFSERNFHVLDIVKKTANSRNCMPEAVCLSYLMSKGSRIHPIIGPQTVSQLKQCLASEKVVLDDRELAQLEAVDMHLTGGNIR